MACKLLKPYIAMEDGAIDIEAIDPYQIDDRIELDMTFEQFCEKLTTLMVRYCPNRRVAHLVRYGRTQRIREKNLIRLWKIELPRLLEALS